ncbi:FKBP-type peptidyl-prolyl cis-trans isomerase [Sinomicrobium weinanense]|uniref:peptidylprolyl isomerase n=1 Tax=Sinomicrobium weinanense TaxID=2842200 RepID=A0A926JQR5_9FLAO|nr:FKBP-type peptidyl-prolyl cis-trans isomerase [Sinomicrobium weinanense]MBC9795718.1 FKBP-type peptidyl-prolyl cis-trans isomerase [Sinomicrobium weinanense]MBU3125281.1 FKBP-type peptidyl-prolyl cis-trans isomerase [Sinomicrobium weinanense]
MEIASKTVVSLRYRLKNGKGEVVEDITGRKPVTYLHGTGHILPALEGHLTGLKVGNVKRFCISEEQGYFGVEGEFYCEVIIDEVRRATDEEWNRGEVAQKNKKECGSDGCC